MSVDVRTRTDSAASPITGRQFFAEVLPAALAANPELVATAVHHLDLPPLCVAVGPDSWVFSTEGDHVVLRRGVTADSSDWQLSDEQASEMALDRLTPIGLHACGKLSLQRRCLSDVLSWWLLWRSVLDRRPVHTAGAISVVNAEVGRSLAARLRQTCAHHPADVNTPYELYT